MSRLTRDELFDIAFKLGEQNDPRGAVEYYSKILELPYPRNNYFNQPVLNNIGNNLVEMKDYDKAIKICSEGISFFPDYYHTYYTRSRAYRELENWEKTIEDCTKCLELYPDYVFALNNRAYCFNEINEFEKAFGDYTKVFKLCYPNNYPKLIKTICLDKLDEGVQLVNSLLSSGHYLNLLMNKKHNMLMIKPTSGKQRVVLYTNHIHFKKSMIRHLKKYTYRLVESEKDVQYFIDLLINFYLHKPNGVCPNYLPMLRYYFDAINKISGYPRGIAVALYNDDRRLVAIDVGVRCNQYSYTSYSGCHFANNAGTAQLVLHALQLEQEGCKIIDYGTPSYRWKYKHDNLGAVVVDDYFSLFDSIKEVGDGKANGPGAKNRVCPPGRWFGKRD